MPIKSVEYSPHTWPSSIANGKPSSSNGGKLRFKTNNSSHCTSIIGTTHILRSSGRPRCRGMFQSLWRGLLPPPCTDRRRRLILLPRRHSYGPMRHSYGPMRRHASGRWLEDPTRCTLTTKVVSCDRRSSGVVVRTIWLDDDLFFFSFVHLFHIYFVRHIAIVPVHSCTYYSA